MIGKTREFPEEIKILEAIVRRFPLESFKKTEFEKKLYRKWAGYKGEKTLDYYLAQMDHSEMVILHDLRIPINGTHFQIDSLIITPYFLLIIDLRRNTHFPSRIQSIDTYTKRYRRSFCRPDSPDKNPGISIKNLS